MKAVSADCSARKADRAGCPASANVERDRHRLPTLGAGLHTSHACLDASVSSFALARHGHNVAMRATSIAYSLIRLSFSKYFAVRREFA